jgi:hypothetical protein
VAISPLAIGVVLLRQRASHKPLVHTPSRYSPTIGATRHMENAFIALSSLIPARSRTSASTPDWRSFASSTTKAGEFDARQVKMGKGAGIARTSFHQLLLKISAAPQAISANRPDAASPAAPKIAQATTRKR